MQNFADKFSIGLNHSLTFTHSNIKFESRAKPSENRKLNYDVRRLWNYEVKPELLRLTLSHEDVGTAIIYVQPDIEDTFEEVKKKVKKLGFNRP